MAEVKLTPSDWLRIVTNEVITSGDVRKVLGCSYKTARQVVKDVLGNEFKGVYSCRTDDFLQKCRHTTRKKELQLIYGREGQ